MHHPRHRGWCVHERHVQLKHDEQNDQLPLPFHHSAYSFRTYLEDRLNKPVAVILTDNSTSMLSMRIYDGVLRVRIHRMFLHTDSRVMHEVVSYLKNERGAMPHFRNFVRDNRELVTRKPPKKVPVKTAGKFHDLLGLYDEINREYFGGLVSAVITWGSRSPCYAVRKRTLGSYSDRSHTIRINPVLDKKTVPRYYVAFVIYHEMLHAALGISIKGKRRSVHSREFRIREKLFKDYEKAMVWEGGKT
jgi:predicted metal-dependent hydrolase